MLEAKAKDQGHRRKRSPTKRLLQTNFQAISKKNFFSGDLQKKKKRSSNFFFRVSPKEENKKGFCKFSARFLTVSYIILAVKKIALSSNRGQDNFEELGLGGQGQGLDLRGQGQGLQNVSLRTCLRTPLLIRGPDLAHRANLLTAHYVVFHGKI